jgi:membrane protein implicated in regulation of membrane protease activity
MKSFKELLREPQFAIALAAAFIIAGWDLAYGSWWIGAIFLVLLMLSIGLNVWKTRKR